MATISMKVAAVLGSMRWQPLSFDKPLLAYSDQPVVVWPLGTDSVAPPPDEPRFGPLEALEVRVPLSPQLAVLMTWADEPDVLGRVEAQDTYAGEMNAFVIAQADKQWMHKLGDEPPVAGGVIRPLSRSLRGAVRLRDGARVRPPCGDREVLASGSQQTLHNDIEVVSVNRR